MKWILLKADHRTEPPQVETWQWNEDERDAAMAELRQQEFNKAEHEEVVLFGADSVDVLRQTHSRYFFSADAIVQNLKSSLHERLTEQLEMARRHQRAVSCAPIPPPASVVEVTGQPA